MNAVATNAAPVVRGTAHPVVSRDELEQFFVQVSTRVEKAEARVAPDSSSVLVRQAELGRFFTAVSHRAERADVQQRRRDKRQATGFNVFDLIEPDENKLSDILADLLNPRGSHGQRDRFLRLLLQQFDLGSGTKLTGDATVQREAPTHGIQKYLRRMDVLVEAGVLLAIENKVNSSEQLDQVKDYMEHLRYCTQRSHRRGVLIYLTPDGRRPESLERASFDEAEADGSLRCWSYRIQLRGWLEQCRSQCAAQKIRVFLSDFIAYIETTMHREPEPNTEDIEDEE